MVYPGVYFMYAYKECTFSCCGVKCSTDDIQFKLVDRAAQDFYILADQGYLLKP